MKIKQTPIGKVIPYARNPRNNAGAVADVAASINEYGWQQPIVVDSEMVVIVGHTRLAAAQQLELKTVPVTIAEGLTPSQVKAYRLADNRVGENATWNDELLRLELDDLNGDSFDLSLTGFTQDELANLFVDKTEGLTDPDDVPEITDSPVSVLGDVWLLGGHRIVCGSCTEVETVDKCLNGVKPHLMVTDPPYGVEYDANWRNDAMRSDGTTAIGGRAIGKVENDDRADWSEAWALFPGEVMYVWHPAGATGLVFGETIQKSGFDIRMVIIWAKSHFPIGRGHYHVQHEPCYYAVRSKGGATGHWCGDRKQTTLWNIPKPSKSETGHSTQKPIECMKRPIENNSSPGQAVYEPFSGSGTTIIAGEMTGRIIHAIELNPAYVDVAVKRWQDFTGKIATLESTGEPFNGK